MLVWVLCSGSRPSSALVYVHYGRMETLTIGADARVSVKINIMLWSDDGAARNSIERFCMAPFMKPPFACTCTRFSGKEKHPVCRFSTCVYSWDYRLRGHSQQCLIHPCVVHVLQCSSAETRWWECWNAGWLSGHLGTDNLYGWP